MPHTKCLFGVLVCALAISATRCDGHVKEARMLDSNALRAVFELALQSKQAASSSMPRERVVEIKPSSASGYAHKEKLTVQGERQTNFPSDYATSALPKKSVTIQEATVDIKPLHMSFGAKTQQQPQPAAVEPTPPYYPLNVFGAVPWRDYAAPYPYAQRALSPFNYGATAPSFVIINPANYPTFHYYNASNQMASRSIFSADDAAVNDAAEQLSGVKSVEPCGESPTTVETEPIFVALPEPAADRLSLVDSILEQMRANANGKDLPLLQLLLQQQQQQQSEQRLRKQEQERVAAFYFRHFNANRK